MTLQDLRKENKDINDFCKTLFENKHYQDVLKIIQNNLKDIVEPVEIKKISETLIFKDFMERKLANIEKEQVEQVRDFASILEFKNFRKINNKSITNYIQQGLKDNGIFPIKVEEPLGKGLGMVEQNLLISDKTIGLFAMYPYNKETGKPIRNYIDYETLHNDIENFVKENPTTKKYINNLMPTIQIPASSQTKFNKVSKIYKNEIAPKLDDLYSSLIFVYDRTYKELENITNNLDNLSFPRNEKDKLFRDYKSKGGTKVSMDLIKKLIDNNLLPGNIEIKMKSIDATPKKDIEYRAQYQMINANLNVNKVVDLLRDVLHNRDTFNKSYLDVKRIDKIFEAMSEKKSIILTDKDKNMNIGNGLTLNDALKQVEYIKKAYKKDNKKEKNIVKVLGE